MKFYPVYKFMDKISKALKKLSEKERQAIYFILSRIKNGQTEKLDIKKLKNNSDIFRARKGQIRIIYLLDKKSGIKILAIERRSDNTYHLKI